MVWDRLAEGEFLHARRVRAWLTIAAAATVGMIGFGLITAKGLHDVTGRPLGSDFISFWAAARVAIAGPVAAAWDVVRHGAEQAAVFGPADSFAAFFYPPVTLLVLWPLGYLPYLAALAVWLGVTIVACRQALVGWAGPWAAGGLGLLAFLAFPAVFSVLGHGQNSFLTTALFAGGGALVARRPVLAGLVFGCLVYKPHMAVVLPLALAAAGQWRTVVAMAVSALGLVGLSVVVFGAEPWIAFFELSRAVRATLEQGLVEPGKMVSIHRAAHMLGASVEAATWVHGVAVAAVLAALTMAVRRHREPDAAIAAAAAATLLVSPFMLDYDEMLLAVPMAWMVRRGLATGFLNWERVGLLATFVLPGVARPLAMGLGVPVAPLVTVLFVGLVLRRVWADGRQGAEVRDDAEGARVETGRAGRPAAALPEAA